MTARRLIVASLLLVFHALALGESVLSVSIPAPNDAQLNAHVYPPSSKTCKGVVVVSHGAGGNERGYSYLGEFFASSSFLTVIPTHRLSDKSALTRLRKDHGLEDGLIQLTTNSKAYKERLVDIGIAKSWAEKKCDSGFSVLLGHSMGAATVMLEAGAKNLMDLSGEDRFDAYIALSPQGEGAIFNAKSWSPIQKPLLSITGTRDDELSGNSWKHRTQPFKNMSAGCKWLAVIDDATHLNFAGLGFSYRTEKYTIEVIDAFLAGINKGCRAPTSLKSLQGLYLFLESDL
ncbi:MAG: alpha/beta hydrolase [Limnobacter sp.]|jgi:predicted dienelactone hydrolase|uniref:Alpha/beta hydrolase n=1 Tax=Limnobacter profundi TaxID=2732163 RepID=A0ABX6N795_9BURK|nr:MULTISPECIES: alpha/beta hydrolase [unclassified Limnobacter]MAG80922.1 alpha/beta hydrolase [Sutterellaceae bacterium]MBA4314414.1 alpha/beta hydrolase [Alcaligenaceae bacterium]MBU0542652.1 alpha/beta hydrolase [Gammaproteobacteria bacterium]PZO12902.1 MAG: alpha/beta hydrolase [Betaproteobacteria bacterium]RJQ25995.1 MAG: alpha/beta hydrolase [Candidatus Parcubacteria bacterium]|tara:strand:- start:2301 stop:3167 length:867 start_codon:yes stop_codon:yes gene_type:complete